MRSNLAGLALLFIWLPFSSSFALSPEEQEELDARIERFYRMPPNPEEMDHRPPKYGLNERRFVSPNAFLGGPDKRASRRYNDHYCKNFLRKKFPGIRCGEPRPEDASIESHDHVSDLAETWMREEGGD